MPRRGVREWQDPRGSGDGNGGMDAGAPTTAAGSVAAPLAVTAAGMAARRVHAVRHLHAMVFGGPCGQRDPRKRTTQRRHRQREGEKKEQQPVEGPRHEEKSSAYVLEQSS